MVVQAPTSTLARRTRPDLRNARMTPFIRGKAESLAADDRIRSHFHTARADLRTFVQYRPGINLAVFRNGDLCSDSDMRWIIVRAPIVARA